MEVNNNSKGVSLRGDKNDKPTQKIFGILDNFSKVLSIPAFLISLYVAINQLRREYFYLVLSENYNAKKLSIPAWDHFSNEEVIDQWRIRLITIIINNNFIFSVVSWDCGKKPIELSNNTYKEFSHDINGSYKGLQKDYITLIVSSGNPIVNAFETLLKTNDINKIGSPY